MNAYILRRFVQFGDGFCQESAQVDFRDVKL